MVHHTQLSYHQLLWKRVHPPSTLKGLGGLGPCHVAVYVAQARNRPLLVKPLRFLRVMVTAALVLPECYSYSLEPTHLSKLPTIFKLSSGIHENISYVHAVHVIHYLLENSVFICFFF